MSTAFRRLPLHAWIGMAILTAAEAGVALRQPLATIWLTPLAWTGYIPAVDGIVASGRGGSRAAPAGG